MSLVEYNCNIILLRERAKLEEIDLKLIDDLSGHKYKEWDILYLDKQLTEQNPYNKIFWVCLCKCGQCNPPRRIKTKN